MPEFSKLSKCSRKKQVILFLLAVFFPFFNCLVLFAYFDLYGVSLSYGVG